MVNYRRELKIEVNIRRRKKIEKVIEFAGRMKRIQKEVEVVLERV